MPDFKEANFLLRQILIRLEFQSRTFNYEFLAVSPKRFEIHKRLIRIRRFDAFIQCRWTEKSQRSERRYDMEMAIKRREMKSKAGARNKPDSTNRSVQRFLIRSHVVRSLEDVTPDEIRGSSVSWKNEHRAARSTSACVDVLSVTLNKIMKFTAYFLWRNRPSPTSTNASTTVRLLSPTNRTSFWLPSPISLAIIILTVHIDSVWCLRMLLTITELSKWWKWPWSVVFLQ